MSQRKTQIEFQCSSELFNGLIVAARPIKGEPATDVYTEREWIKLLSALDLSRGFFKLAHRHQMQSIPVVTGGVVRIEFERTLKPFFGSRPVPIIVGSDLGKRGVGLCQLVVDF